MAWKGGLTDVRFGYFYGTDGERFRFYMMPRALVENPIFNSLSAEAKILYVLLLDRMQLSVQNQWRDEEDRQVHSDQLRCSACTL